MLDENILNALGTKLYELREFRAEGKPPADDLNDLIADLMNGLETLFIIVNATVAHGTTPQASQATFVSVSEPNKPKRL